MKEDEIDLNNMMLSSSGNENVCRRLYNLLPVDFLGAVKVEFFDEIALANKMKNALK